MSQILSRTALIKDGREITLETPQPGEGANLLSCVLDVIAVSQYLLTTAEEFKFTAEQEEELIKRFLDDPNKVLIVPKIGKRIIGMMDFSAGTRKRNSHFGEFGMSVHPDFQGQGIGRHMIEALIDWAKAHPQIETLRLRVHSKNVRAHALYLSCGFEEEGRERDGVKLAPGVYDDVICMARFVR